MIYFYFIIFAIVIVMTIVTYFNSDRYRVRKALEGAAVVAIGGLQAGALAKVIGVVRPLEGKLLVAPLTGRKCVFYEVVVEEKVSSGKSTNWRERIREVDQVDFTIEDDTGTALVRARDLKQVASADRELRSGIGHDATPELEAYLTRHGMTSVGLVFNKALRYREGVFEPGERVAVLGRVVLEADPDAVPKGDGAYRAPPQRACLQAPEGGHLIVSDEPRST